MAFDLGGFDLGGLLGGGGGGGKNTGGGGGNSGFLSPSGKGASAAYADAGGDVITHGLQLDSTTLLIAAAIAGAVVLLVALIFKPRR